MNYDINKLIEEEPIVIEFIEGHGNYEGVPSDPNFHSKGRMGAQVNVHQGGLVYTIKDASSFPDGLGEKYVGFNDGLEVPTIEEGIYNLYASTMKNGTINAFKVESPTAVIRAREKSTSTGIFVHERDFNDPKTYASSVGCLTIEKTAMNYMFEFLGIKTFSGQYIGKLVVNRSEMPKEIYQHYSAYYAHSYKHIATDKILTVEQIHMNDLDDPDFWDSVRHSMNEGFKRGAFTPEEQKTLLAAGQWFDQYIKDLHYNGNQ